MSGDWAYWLIGLGVIAINAALVYLAWWALFADRAKGRRRCPKCWYDMAYAPPPGMRCAECGYIAKKESQFHRTRRRFAIAFGAIFASTAICLYVTERATNRGFMAFFPTQALIWMLPLNGAQDSGYKELMYRLSSGDISDAQWRSLMRRAAAGDSWHEPTTDIWQEKYGQLIWALRPTFISKPELEAPLFLIPPRIDITTREKWPQGMPVTLLVNVRDWWPWGMECRIEATPSMNGTPGEPLTFYRTADVRFQRTPFAMHLPAMEGTQSAIEVELKLSRRRWPANPQGMLVSPGEEDDDENWEHVITRKIALTVQSGSDLPLAVGDEEMLKIMKRTFSEGVVRWSEGRSPVRFSASIQNTFVTEFDDTAIGVDIDLIFDGQIARRLSMWWLAGSNSGNPQLPDRGYGYEVQQEVRELLVQADADDPRWQIRVQSNPQLALRAGQSAKMWQGEFSILLRLTARESTAPPRPWRR